jgi:alpha-L-rhamnosidase
VAGLALAAPGGQELRIAPLPLPDLDWAETGWESPYGLAEASWEAAAGGMSQGRPVVNPPLRLKRYETHC